MENVFDAKYNAKLDKVKIGKGKSIHRIFGFIYNHKFISVIFVSFIVLSGINFYLIYSFMKILENGVF